MRNSTSQSSSRARVDPTQIILVMILCSIGFAFILGLSISSNPERQALALEEQRAVQPWKIASRVTGYVVFGVVSKVGLAVIAGYVIFYLIAILRNWLDLRARQIHARDGLFPVVEVQKGVLYDPNRDNAGAHPLITVAALGVQRQAATKAERIIIKQSQSDLGAGSLQALEQQPEDNLPSMISLPDVVGRCSLEALALGVGERGPVKASLNELMHILAVGASGFGKSAFIRALIWQMAQAPEPCDVIAIDISGSEFNTLQGWSRLLYPVARDARTAAATLRAVRAEIETRKGLYEAHPTAYDLASYNRQAQEPLSPMVILTDEATNMLNQAGLGEPLREVTQTARQYGVYLLLAGQSAKATVIDTQTRDNFSTRLCFHTSPASRRVVLGESVQDISERGRAWLQMPGSQIQQIQVPYVSRDELAKVLEPAGTPRQMPKRLLEAEPREEDAISQKVRSLHAQGLSDTAIARTVFRYGNPHYISKVREILQQQQQRQPV